MSSVIAAQGLAAQSVLRWWQKVLLCVAYFACAITIIIFIIISFVFLLSCLYLKSFAFSCSPPHPTGGEGGMSEWLCDPSCRRAAAWS